MNSTDKIKGGNVGKKTKTTPDVQNKDKNLPIKEKSKIDKAVQYINEKIGKRYYETAIDVGNYVLKTFFRDDINEVKSRNPKKLLSFNKLCARPDLEVHPKHLNQMVLVAAQERLLIDNLGADKVNNLGYSLKVELLKIRDDKMRSKIALEWISNPKTILEAKKDISSLRESTPAVSDLIPLSSPFIDQLKTISEWTENDELEGKLEGLSINKIKKIKDHIDAFLEKYEPVKTKLDDVKAKIDPIYETKKKEIDKRAATPKKRGRPKSKKGEKVPIKPKKLPFFKSGKELKERLNQK